MVDNEVKPKKKSSEIFDEKLFSEKGFRKLREVFSIYKTKKNSDLMGNIKDLLFVYQKWANELYPDKPFSKVIQKIESKETEIEEYLEHLYCSKDNEVNEAFYYYTKTMDSVKEWLGDDKVA